MRANTWQAPKHLAVENVPDPKILNSNDAIVKITSTAICGSDLHLYDGFNPFMEPGDILGHEPMGIVEEVGSAVKRLKKGDRVVVPFTISCGTCWACEKTLYSLCQTTRVESSRPRAFRSVSNPAIGRSDSAACLAWLSLTPSCASQVS